ncbi:GAF domain-containing protein [Chlorogloeopsis sp. ULAP01]|uniref:PAS domain-containing sensor histidine kinase n=1 Tax=Chlorogloeopsis sp. ULAP01 TaxID=3056483 RepID=UPI0025AAE8D6|nr:GAF domain-containing protein [Chlorogloeopsis sp. ULAP01]MDM9385486.1 GAF domain-containing protein [Chlorogloeopsis sp. ULAP01]
MTINPSESTTELAQPSCQHFQINTDIKNQNHQQFLCSICNYVQASVFVIDVLEDGNFRYLGINPIHEHRIGMSSEELQGRKLEEVLSPVDAARARQHYADCVRFGKTISYEECLEFQGIPTWWSTTLTPLWDESSRIYRLIGTSTNISDASRQAATRLCKQAEEALRRQAEREKLLGTITQGIRDSLDFDAILNQIVTELRRFLMSDRVLIYRFQDDSNGVIIAESTIVSGTSLVGINLQVSCFTERHLERYKSGCIQIVEDIYAAGLHPCQIDVLASLQVRANLVVPIIFQQDLWGLLITQHCCEPRQWQQTEIDLLEQLATQIGIAAQQAKLYRQVQALQAQLKWQQQTLQVQGLMQRLSEQIRDNLDIDRILETATEELGRILQADRCQIELYNARNTLATVAHEYTTTPPLCQGAVRVIEDFPELYEPLLQKQSLQFGKIMRDWNPRLVVITQLACPIFDLQGVMGNIWLTRATEKEFEGWEVNLVQQIANQCAIAICQSRLWQQAKTRLTDIETLENLKHEFLRTLSHELRTPITSICLAVQTLDSIIRQENVLDTELVSQLLQILQSECGRESKLINDLLTLTYLEAEIEPLTLITIDLQSWLPPIVESFRELTACHQQNLILDINGELPCLETDITDLERIITELLNNACKYTPAGGSIMIAASAVGDTVQISVTNYGIGIATNELSRIFEPFYRIPQHDPWKHTGTGMGLALVQKLVKHLKASIRVESQAAFTTFTLSLPREIKV